MQTLDQIRVIDRFREIPHEGAMADLVWSDPISPSPSPSPSLQTSFQQDPLQDSNFTDRGDFAVSPRGAGYVFGKEVTRRFLDMNGLDHIVRAHQLWYSIICMTGEFFSLLMHHFTF